MARGPIVGREAELKQLAEALADARDGRGGVVLLVGEPGIGKSRLVEEAGALAAADVVWGRAWEAGGAPPYWPWTQVLRAIGGPASSVHVARLRGDVAEAPVAAVEDRFLLFDAVTRHLIGARRPLVVILEDLHAADEPSLHLLAFIATQLARSPILIVGTYRDVEARLTASAGALLDRIARGARVIQPRRLGAEHVVAIAAADPALALDTDSVHAVYQRSEGNPLFVVELLRVIARRGAQGAAPAKATSIGAPASVRTAIREHLRGLPAEIAGVLDAAAVIGRELSISVLAEVCQRSALELTAALDAAVELGVLVERTRGRYAFAHGLIQETRHDDLPADRRAELHLAVANALERDPAKPLTEIAHHLLDAGPEHVDRAAAVAQQAAERARRQLAFEPAAALIDRVLATAPPSSALARFELVRLLAEVRILAGDDVRGKEAAREAAELARTLGSAELLARAALTYGLYYNVGLTDQVMVQLLEEALAALPPGDSPLRARMLARLAAALTPTRDMNPPMQIAREAIAMAQRLDDDRTRLEVIFAALSALSLFAPPAERAALSRQTLELAEKFDEPLIALRSHQRIVFDQFQLGDLVAVDTHRRAYDELLARVRLPRARWFSPAFTAMRALLHGHFDEHGRALAEAQRLAAEAGDAFFDNIALPGHLITVARIVGDDEVLRRDRKKMERVWHARGQPYREVAAMFHARLGELDELRAMLAAYPRLVDEVKAHQLVALGGYLSEAAFELGDLDLAAALHDWMVTCQAPLTAFHMHGFAVERPTAHYAMLLAATLGDVAAARSHYVAASALLRALDARPLEAWLQLDFARALIAAGQRGDEPRKLLASVRAINGALGMQLAARIAAVEAQLAPAVAASREVAPAAPPREVAPVDGVQLRCEGEYWLVEGCGGSCRIKATKGVEWLARLVGEANREIHVLDLVGSDGADAGDAGEVIDKEARAAYRARVAELREELEEAEGWNDAARAERVRDELEAIESELVRAAGLGGRERRVGRAAERARINVQRRLADALKRIADANAALGKHLGATIRTGVYCSYVPQRATRAR
jgi:hypothetical protein